MMLVVLLSWLIAFNSSYAYAQSGSDVLSYAITNLPSCALDCTLATISTSKCELTDLDCIKQNKQLLQDLTLCVKSSCSVRDSLTAKKFLQQLMNAPVRDNTKIGTFTCLIVGGVAVLAYILRLIARLPVFGATWGLDDWVMTAAIVVVIPMTFCAYLLNQIGLGQDMWMVPFDNITKVLKIFYFTELLYLTAIGLTKISILLFYLRLFPHKGLRRAIYVTIALCILYIIGFVIATALQCIPVRISWERWDGEHHGRCMNLNVHAWASAGFNMILDLVIIILPVRQVSKLAMSRRRRFGVMIMFLGGGFVTIVSVLRLEYMVQFSHTENVTWDYMPIGIWSAVETHVGVIVACMPAIRSLQMAVHNRLYPKDPSSSTYYEDGSKENTKKSNKMNPNSVGTIHRHHTGNKEFVELDEWELKDDARRTSPGGEVSVAENLAPSFGSHEDMVPLTISSAPTGQESCGIRVQKEYSVDTEEIGSGHYQRAGWHGKNVKVGEQYDL